LSTRRFDPAVQAGAEVLYRAVLTNVDRLGQKTGNLKGSIYQAYSTHQSTPEHVQYEVSWNPRKAPHGFIVENGHLQRYASYVGSDGKVAHDGSSDAKGKPKPNRRHASQAEKDAYLRAAQRRAGASCARSFRSQRCVQALPAGSAAIEAKFTELMK
jgi:hypothetical protein